LIQTTEEFSEFTTVGKKLCASRTIRRRLYWYQAYGKKNPNFNSEIVGAQSPKV
jgi:hypothetical protein